MSVPSPNFRHLVQHLMPRLHECHQQLRKEKSKVEQVALDHFKAIEEQAFAALQNPASIQLLDKEDWQWLIGYIRSLPELQGLNKEALLEEIIDLAAFFSHRDEIEQKGLLHFLAEPWALHEFKLLVESKDPWALNNLEKLLAQPLDAAFDLLVELLPHHRHLEPLFIRYFHHPHFEAYCEKILLGELNEETKPRLHFLAHALTGISELKENPKIYEFLLGHLNLHSNSIIKKLLEHLLLNPKNHPILSTLFIDQLLLKTSWVIEVYQKVLSSFESDNMFQNHPFIQFLMKRAFNEVSLQVILIASISTLPSMQRLEALLNKIDSFSKDMVNRNIFRSLLLAHRQLNRQLYEAEKFSFFDEPFSWSKMPSDYKFAVMQALLTRKKDLILFFLGQVSTADFMDPPANEHFPKPNCALVGLNKKNSPFVEQLANLPSKGDFPVAAVSNQEVQLKKGPQSMHLMDGALKPQIWVRDYFFNQTQSVRFPPFFEITGEMAVEAKLKQHQRTNLPASFPIMGAVNNFQGQLKTFEYILKMMDQGLIPKKELKFNFLYNEGGNTLKGTDFAIVGKDVLGLNRRALQRELYEMGVHFDENQNVYFKEKKSIPELRVTPNDPEEEANFANESYEIDKQFSQVTEAQMKALLQLDFGVKDAFFIEQSEYHLDVNAHLVDPENKVIVLNDSLLAYEQMVGIARKRIDELSSSKTPPLKGEKDSLAPLADDATSAPASQRASQDREFIPHERLDEREKLYLKDAKLRKRYEDLAESDLKAQGFTVKRAPGCFSQLENESPIMHQINFFNFVTFTNGEGQPCIIALGCDEDYQKLFREFASNHLPQVAGQNIYFAPEKVSKRLLKEGGGIHCILQML